MNQTCRTRSTAWRKLCPILWASLAASALLFTACGGGGGGGGATGTSSTTTTVSSGAVTAATCSAGTHNDYLVGPAQSYTTLESVPWELLTAGDTVRIQYNNGVPYYSKFVIFGSGTSTAPIRVCGIPGPNGERPIIDGTNAQSRAQLATYIDPSNLSTRAIYEGHAIIEIKNNGNNYYGYPSYIQIDGLNIRNASPVLHFVNTSGVSVAYDAGGGPYNLSGNSSNPNPFISCVWIDRGWNITISNNEINGCPLEIYSKSNDFGFGTANPYFPVTQNLLITGNYLHGAGYDGNLYSGYPLAHTTYTESNGVVIEFNTYDPPAIGGGNSVKDRSIGTIVRFNLIKGGAHAIDLVEAEDFPQTALANPAYRTSLVYGNLISKDATTGSVIHYGGDHFYSAIGNMWGEPIFRQGTLYFYNNTMLLTVPANLSSPQGTTGAFQMSTTLESVTAWNNIFVYDPYYANKFLRATEYSIDPPPTSASYNWVPGGVLNLGANFVTTGWGDSATSLSGALSGWSQIVSSTTLPIDLTTFIPVTGSIAIDAGTAAPGAASSATAPYPVDHQISATGQATARSIHGAAIDLGAIEK